MLQKTPPSKSAWRAWALLIDADYEGDALEALIAGKPVGTAATVKAMLPESVAATGAARLPRRNVLLFFALPRKR